MKAPASHFALSVFKENAKTVKSVLVKKMSQDAQNVMRKFIKKMKI